MHAVGTMDVVVRHQEHFRGAFAKRRDGKKLGWHEDCPMLVS